MIPAFRTVKLSAYGGPAAGDRVYNDPYAAVNSIKERANEIHDGQPSHSSDIMDLSDRTSQEQDRTAESKIGITVERSELGPAARHLLW